MSWKWNQGSKTLNDLQRQQIQHLKPSVKSVAYTLPAILLHSPFKCVFAAGHQGRPSPQCHHTRIPSQLRDFWQELILTHFCWPLRGLHLGTESTSNQIWWLCLGTLAPAVRDTGDPRTWLCMTTYNTAQCLSLSKTQMLFSEQPTAHLSTVGSGKFHIVLDRKQWCLSPHSESK